jgi:hypothetical protein
MDLLDAATNRDVLRERHDGLLLVLKVVAEAAILVNLRRTLICGEAYACQVARRDIGFKLCAPRLQVRMHVRCTNHVRQGTRSVDAESCHGLCMHAYIHA